MVRESLAGSFSRVCSRVWTPVILTKVFSGRLISGVLLSYCFDEKALV